MTLFSCNDFLRLKMTYGLLKIDFRNALNFTLMSKYILLPNFDFLVLPFLIFHE